MHQRLVVAEINEAPQNDYKGLRLVRTALVPIELLDEVLSTPGGIGYEVRSWGLVPHLSTQDRLAKLDDAAREMARQLPQLGKALMADCGLRHGQRNQIALEADHHHAQDHQGERHGCHRTAR